MKHNHVLALLALFASACTSARAQSLTFHGNYSGNAMFASTANSYVDYGAQGSDPAASSGLTTAYFATGGFLGWKDSKAGYFWGGERIGCALVADDGSRLDGMCSGEGSTDGDIAGTFTIRGGTGRFQGYGGGGTWRSHPVDQPTHDFQHRSVVIFVDGNAAPVPEPSALALIVSAFACCGVTRAHRSRRLC